MPNADIAADWSALACWAGEQRAAVDAQLAEREAALARARTAVEVILAGLRTRCADAQVQVSDDATYDSLTVLAAKEQERATGALERVRLDRTKAERLRQSIDELTDQAGVADELGRLLSARGFEAWVLAEAQDELVAGASKTLEELSQGAYSLGVNEAGEFVVIDHGEADATRPAKTLSGGETFQASLALALALADRLGQFAIGGASKLESIFLDEGFGTLDDDSLDVVAATLDALSKGSRIVGVVTHVKELAARVPVRFEVRRSGRTAVLERVVGVTAPASVRFAVDPWDPGYAGVAAAPAEPGIAASYAAGVVVCDGAASVEQVVVERGLFTASPVANDVRTPCGEVFRARMTSSGELEALSAAMQQRMRATEIDVATVARERESRGVDDLLVVDGPLRGHENLPRAVGYIKTHQASYLPPDQHAVVAQLEAGERTPAFTLGSHWIRHTWYPAAPNPSDACVGRDREVRVLGGPGPPDAIALADVTTATLAAFASAGHKDGRAPQNLYPIAGLERTLRHRLGDRMYVYRELCRAASARAGVDGG